ncbi:MAG: hypothetical protein M3Z31_07095 [Pseudomonadota bacterium]|nr:hypothetical protein [Pseudomonadota bacterium]
MSARTSVIITLVALGLAGCAAQGSQVSYREFLPNTNEDPAWAHNPPGSADYAAGSQATPPGAPR